MCFTLKSALQISFEMKDQCLLTILSNEYRNYPRLYSWRDKGQDLYKRMRTKKKQNTVSTRSRAHVIQTDRSFCQCRIVRRRGVSLAATLMYQATRLEELEQILRTDPPDVTYHLTNDFVGGS